MVGLALACAGSACRTARPPQPGARVNDGAERMPTFAGLRDQLPAPIYEENPAYVDCYWEAWRVVCAHVRQPTAESGFVSPYVDLDFNQNIFFWDTCLMTMFCNYAPGLTPGVAALDNFYAKQHETGEICREINRDTGRDFEPWTNREAQPLFSRCGWGGWDRRDQGPTPVEYRGRAAPTPPPLCTLDALNHPLAAWAELESFRVTGDAARLHRVWTPLARYYAALQTYLRQGNGLYITDWASMDNSPRNMHVDRGGTAVDTSAQMVLFARGLAEMADVLGKPDDAAKYRAEANALAERINALMWDPARRFYFDLSVDGERGGIKTIAAFWTLLAGAASPWQARALAAELENPATFGTHHRAPSLAADESQFAPGGEYWRGSVWSPMDMMIVRGLERYGFTDLAYEIALNHLENVTAVYLQTGAIWENYAPTRVARGDGALRDLVGFSGLGPINFLLEYGIGLRPDAPNRRLTWTIRSERRVGCDRYRFGDVAVSLVCEPADPDGQRELRAVSTGDIRLRILLHGRPYGFELIAGQPLRVRLKR
ncbi:Glucosidase YgjK precursor [Phycisphaerae bacterium RAS1]|nr:Glucosidase YgjK precursor [Phycisphaerae bacterium RAS1]